MDCLGSGRGGETASFSQGVWGPGLDPPRHRLGSRGLTPIPWLDSGAEFAPKPKSKTLRPHLGSRHTGRLGHHRGGWPFLDQRQTGAPPGAKTVLRRAVGVV